MHKNFKNEIFYTRLRKFKQSQKKFSNLYVRLRKFKQRQKRLKKTLYSETHENLNKLRKIENLYARL